MESVATVVTADPLISEAMALTEKKMDMALDDIIKMSKKTVKAKKQRVPNKSKKVQKNTAQDKSAKVRHFLNSRSSLRQGALAQRRTNFQGTQFPLTTEAAQKAATASIRNGPSNRNRRVSWNKPRVGAPQAQRMARNVGCAVKMQQPQQQQQGNVVPRQRSQTLDSLFANMKQQRMRVVSQQNIAHRRGGIGQQRQQRGRGRYAY